MFEEIRDHDPRPSSQERAWMQADPFHAMARVMVLAALAVMIGTAASELQAVKAPTVVAAAP
ncbi:MAG: hypothetical protein ABI789_06465 [Usitatibacter sp.]